MRAVLVERVLDASLAPLLERRPAALLPLANRPLLDLQMEGLAAAGVSRLDLYLQSRPSEVREHVRLGERWGLEVHCHSVRRAERCLSPGSAWETGAEPVLAMALDLLWRGDALGRQLQDLPRGLTQLTDGAGQPLPMRVWRPARGQAASRRRACAGWLLLDGIQAYARANRLILRTLAGTAHTERAFANGLYLGAGAQLHDSAQVRGTALVGAGAHLAAGASLAAESIVGRGCVLDRDATLEGCVVLPGSYVGVAALLRDKVVDGHWLIDIHQGHAAYVADPLLLGESAPRRLRSAWASRAVHWLGAALAALLVLPPVLLWCVGRRLRGRRALVRELRYLPAGRDLSGQRLSQALPLWSLAAGQPHWRRLPWLIEVLRGRLALVGTARPPRVAEALQAGGGRYALLTLPGFAAVDSGGLATLLQNERGSAWRALQALLRGLLGKPSDEPGRHS